MREDGDGQDTDLEHFCDELSRGMVVDGAELGPADGLVGVAVRANAAKGDVGLRDLGEGAVDVVVRDDVGADLAQVGAAELGEDFGVGAGDEVDFLDFRGEEKLAEKRLAQRGLRAAHDGDLREGARERNGLVNGRHGGAWDGSAGGAGQGWEDS